MFFMVNIPIHIPTNNAFPSFPFSPTLLFLVFFDNSCSNRYKEVSHRFGLNFSNNKWRWTYFHVTVGYLIFWEVFTHSSPLLIFKIILFHLHKLITFWILTLVKYMIFKHHSLLCRLTYILKLNSFAEVFQYDIIPSVYYCFLFCNVLSNPQRPLKLMY